ncbi:MAG: hypothetical protein J7J92_02995 [Candidatus Aenigmarchaeota archaeon]|nr:hypothetical protein [Candidatus Aenigmarchaeota archaeon]
MEFWNDQATDRSWNILIKLAKKYKFVLIGDWACYLHTGTIKSKDIDIIVDFETLNQMKKEFLITKTAFLKKYEAIVENISIDIYVPYFSKLVIPLDYIQKNTIKKEGIELPKPEILLILKQQAELERRDKVKGQKDRVDILNILLKGNIDMKKYFFLVKKYNLEDYVKRLQTIIRTSKIEFEYLGILNPRTIKLIKKKLMKDFTIGKLSVN